MIMDRVQILVIAITKYAPLLKSNIVVNAMADPVFVKNAIFLHNIFT